MHRTKVGALRDGKEGRITALHELAIHSRVLLVFAANFVHCVVYVY